MEFQYRADDARSPSTGPAATSANSESAGELSSSMPVISLDWFLVSLPVDLLVSLA
jgi:hypothetical protein